MYRRYFSATLKILKVAQTQKSLQQIEAYFEHKQHLDEGQALLDRC